MRKSKVQAELNRADVYAFIKTASNGHNRRESKQPTTDIVIVVCEKCPKLEQYHNKSNFYSIASPNSILLSPQKAVA
mgnify:FL=1